VFIQGAAARPSSDSCELPKDLQGLIASKYPETRLVGISDLNEADRRLFQKEHVGSCPGLVKVDFYGDGKPTLALSLTTKSQAEPKTYLVLAHSVDNDWKASLLETANGVPIPVVWSEKPGEYKGIYGKKIHAARPVIVFCGYSSWAVLYAWMGNRIAKTWLAD
jgi:hypothetical protein